MPRIAHPAAEFVPCPCCGWDQYAIPRTGVSQPGYQAVRYTCLNRKCGQRLIVVYHVALFPALRVRVVDIVKCEGLSIESVRESFAQVKGVDQATIDVLVAVMASAPEREAS